MPGKEIKSEREFYRLIQDEHKNGRILAALFYNPNDDPEGNDFNSIKAKFKVELEQIVVFRIPNTSNSRKSNNIESNTNKFLLMNSK